MRNRNTKNYILSTSLLLGVATMVCIFTPSIMPIFSLCGGLFCTFIGWTIPFILRIRMLDKKKFWTYPKCRYYLGLVFILFITVASTVQSIGQFSF